MLHNLTVMVTSLASGVLAHLSLWEGWAVAIAAALLVFHGAAWWLPFAAALIINPEPFGLVAGLIHNKHVSLYGALVFTLCQAVLAFGGFAAARLIRRLR